jgi:hypothetical protein
MNKPNKNISTLIAIVLTITMIASTIFAVLPIANAQTVQKYPTFLYAAAAPNPVGVGQPITIVTGCRNTPRQAKLGNVSSPTGRRWIVDTYKPTTRQKTLLFHIQIQWGLPITNLHQTKSEHILSKLTSQKHGKTQLHPKLQLDDYMQLLTARKLHLSYKSNP